MDDQLILEERIGSVAKLVLNNPARRNAMDYKMVRALIEALKAADGEPGVRAVIIAGCGDHFSAGGNLKEFAEELKLPAFEHWEAADPWLELFRLVREMRVPVICAVRGYALAGACGLVSLCDLAVAAEDAKVGVTEIRIGLFPMIVFPALRRAVGERKALEMALTGRIYEASEALQMGLFNRVVASEELEEATLELAEQLAQKGPAAIAMGKRLFYATQDMGYEESLEFARNIRVVYMLAEDVEEGVDAFLNKREPDWG